MTRARLIVVGLIVLAAVAGSVGSTFSSFTATTSNTGDRVLPARIFPRDRFVPAWSINDASSGTAASASSAVAYSETLYLQTSNAATSYASNRFVDVEMSDLVPAGLAVTSATAEIEFSDDSTDGNQACLYYEARRISTDAVIGTYGSTSSNLGCQAGTVPTILTQSMPEITTATAANDLKLRLFMKDGGATAARIHRVAVNITTLGHTWTQLPTSTTDQLDTSPATAPWSLAKTDGTAWQNANNWSAGYSATRYVSYTFPATVPAAASAVSVTLEDRWKASTTANHCMYFEAYSNGALIGTHGSSASPVWCSSGSTAYRNDTIALSEVDTPQEANNLVIKMYTWGGARTDHDRVVLKTNWMLKPSGCIDGGTQTIIASRDSWTDQNAPTSTTGGTNIDLNVKSQSSKNRRTYLYFPLPAIPSGCTLSSAVLRAYLPAASGTRTLQASAANAAWTEFALAWNNQPASSGTPVGITAATGWNQWTVTTLVSSMYSGSNYGFILKDSAEDAGTAVEQKFDSRNELQDRPPALQLTFTG